jgi:hypothetical protein
MFVGDQCIVDWISAIADFSMGENRLAVAHYRRVDLFASIELIAALVGCSMADFVVDVSFSNDHLLV